MVPRPRNGLSLCAGGGGLDMGLMLAEPGFHARCFVEWEEYPRSTLIAAQRAGYFAPAPIWDDVTTFDARPFAGAFDILLAGYPCQPFSQAGRRRGANDERHLWPDIARIIGELGDGLEWVFLENVAGHVTLGLDTVLRDLWGLGFTPAAGLFSAGETGAPHERLRVFIVAHRNVIGDYGSGARRSGWRGEPADGSDDLAHTNGRKPGQERQQRSGQQRLHPEGGRHPGDMADPEGGRGGIHAGSRGEGSGAPDARGSIDRVGNAARLGRGEGRSESELRGGRDAASGAGSAMGDTDGERHAQRVSFSRVPEGALGTPSWEALDRARPVLFPPGPADADAWAYVIRSAPGLAPALSIIDVKRACDHVAQMVVEGGMEEGEAQSDLRLMAHGLAARPRALRLLGNGVFPLAAAYAWRTLSAAHGLRPVDLAAPRGAGGASADRPIQYAGAPQ